MEDVVKLIKDIPKESHLNKSENKGGKANGYTCSKGRKSNFYLSTEFVRQSSFYVYIGKDALS